MGDFSQQKLTFDDVITVGNVFPNGATNANTINSHAPGISTSGFLASYIATCRAAAGTGGTASPSNNNRSWIGEQWATGMPGRSLGNLLFPPNTKEYNCMSCAGLRRLRQRGHLQAVQLPPGRLQRRHGRRLGAVPEGQHQHQRGLGASAPGRRARRSRPISIDRSEGFEPDACLIFIDRRLSLWGPPVSCLL